jgi:hypothetical protein
MEGENPRISWPIIIAEIRSFVRRKLLDKQCTDMFANWTVLTVVSSEDPGIFEFLLMIDAHILIGHNNG